jgi:hypothetical protein
MTSFQAELRDQLVRAAGRRRALALRRTAMRAGAVAAVVVAAVGAVSLARPEPASAGVDIKVEDGLLVVRLTDYENRDSAIQRAIRDAGVDVAVTSAPTGPSLVGHFTSASISDSDFPDALRELDPTGAGFAAFSIPVDWPGHLDLVVGRPAEPGEAYVAFTDAFAPGEPLACSGLLRATLADASAKLAGTPLSAKVMLFSAADAGPPTPLADVLADHGAWHIVDAQATSATDIVLSATEDGRAITGQEPNVSESC